MASAAAESLTALYTEDETAWLEAMAEAARRGDLAALDLHHLSEYLTDMALRDRRQVKNRLVVLLTHLLKWQFQKERRSRSWRTTVLTQRQRLADLAGAECCGRMRMPYWPTPTRTPANSRRPKRPCRARNFLSAALIRWSNC